MRRFIKCVLVVVFSVIISGCEELFVSRYPCSLSMTIDAPTYNLKNCHYAAVCKPSHHHNGHFYILDDELHFEINILTHDLESKRDKNPSAKLIIALTQHEIPFELNKKYYFESSGDVLTSDRYCIATVRLYLNGECYSSHDGWIKVTEILLDNGEPFTPDYNSYIDQFTCEFEFTAEKDGKKVVISNGRYTSW